MKCLLMLKNNITAYTNHVKKTCNFAWWTTVCGFSATSTSSDHFFLNLSDENHTQKTRN